MNIKSVRSSLRKISISETELLAIITELHLRLRSSGYLYTETVKVTRLLMHESQDSGAAAAGLGSISHFAIDTLKSHCKIEKHKIIHLDGGQSFKSTVSLTD